MVKLMGDLQLLREYAEQRSERGFTEFVNRHMDLVYSTALRVVTESQLAEDVTQMVCRRERCTAVRRRRALRQSLLRAGFRLRRVGSFILVEVQAHSVCQDGWRTVNFHDACR